MFGLGKVDAMPKKAKRRHSFAFYVVGAFALAIEAMLGINVAFLVDQSLAIVAHNMLDGTFMAVIGPMIALVIALVIGLCFILGGMWTFAGFLDNLDDARAYQTKYASWWWPQAMVWGILLAVVLLDYTTLIFRAAYFAEKGASALFWFFFILILVPFILGAFMHVLENTPRDRRHVKAERHIEQVDADAYEDTLQTMPDYLRTRYLDGDEDALQEWYEQQQQMRDDARQQELNAMDARDAQKRRRQEDAQEKQRNAITPAGKRTRLFPRAVPTHPGNPNGQSA